MNLTSSTISTLTPEYFTTSKEEAIPLITFDTTTKKFFINDKAEEILKKLEGPIGVISVAGMYRTGKSYLLNRMLLNRSDGFSVGPTINPCTKGLWIWPKPLNGFSPDGTPLNVLVIDTEGIGATDEDQNHDNKIFTLGILLSSYFIFNSLGSIDENAIQNLSFIVNITKNIQLHNSKNEDVDLRDISKYLPSFMWVIRDFSLKLTDLEGETITSKEYMEKSLDLQKGFSETVESKNKIRSLIKEFFRERDCVTLIRPLTEEENLQNLCRMDQSKLRHEFLEQISGLRKKVLHKVKAKTMNGKTLNGEMFCNLMNSYVNAINSGAVPVIENAWSYMCKNECTRSMNSALVKYMDLMDESVKDNLPMFEKELEAHHQESKISAIESYHLSALGIYLDEFLLVLKNKIKEKHLQYKIENEKESKKSCENFLEVKFSEIKQNLNRNLYQSNFSEFKSDVESFINDFYENAPNGPGKNLFLYEFLVNEVLYGSEKFFMDLKEDFNISSENYKEEINKLNNLIGEMKGDFLKESFCKTESIKKMENEISELFLQDKYTKENLNFVVKEKENIIKELTERMENTKKDYEKKIIDMRSKLEMTEESTREAEREMKMKTSEFEKSKLLLEQKIKFLEKTVDELSHKEDQNFNEIKLLRKESFINSKDSVEKYENQIRTLNEKYELMQDKNIDLETKLMERERRTENEKIKSEEQMNELKKKIEELTGLLNMTEGEVKILENKTINEKDKIKTEFEMKIAEFKNENEKVNSRLKDSEEKFIELKNKSIREISTLKQNLEFSEMQIKEFKNQMTDEKKSQEAMIKILEDKNSSLTNSNEELHHQISDLTISNLNEYNKLKNELEEKESEFKIEKENLDSLCLEYETNLKKKLEELEKLKEEVEKNNFKFGAEINDLTSQLKSTLSEKENIISQHKLAIENLNIVTNQKIEGIFKQCRTEIEDNNERNEKNINEIRRHFEVEKDNLDLKLNDEKEKMNEKINDIENYYLDRIKENDRIRDEKIYELEEELQSLETRHSNYLIHTEQELAVRNQEIDSLSKQINDYKENLFLLQKTHETILEKNADRFKEEKIEIQNTFEKLNKENREKERENGCLFTKNEQLEKNIEMYKDQLKTQIQETKLEKCILEEKINHLIQKNQNQNDELVSVKSESSKEMALKVQEMEFHLSKMTQMQNTLDDYNTKTEEKIKMIKEAIEADLNEKITLLNKEKLELETKLTQKRKEIKEQEINFNKDKSMLEREKAVLIEKLMSVNKQKDELAESLEKERESFESKLESNKQDLRRESEMTVKENEMMRIKLRKLENDYNELYATYEKDSDLWTTKFLFLEEQRNQARLDLNECQKKFEIQLENLTTKGIVEKDKKENLQSVIFATIESKFKSNYKDLQENYNSKLEELNSKRKSLENENKSLMERLKEKANNFAHLELEKKFNLISENENKLRKELESVTEDKEKKIIELAAIVDTERAINKDKILELESKLREFESKRSNLAVDTIKEKVLNDKDKQIKQKEVETLNEKINTIERINLKLINENKELIRENEKLKKSSKVSSKNNSNIFLPKYAQRFLSADKENNRNHSNTSFDMRSEIRPYENRLDLLEKFSTTKNSSQKSIDDNLNTSEF